MSQKERQNKPFYLEKRKDIFYVIFKNPKTGKKLSARSTGQTKKDEAYYIALKWYHEGIPEQGLTKTRNPAQTFDIDELIYKLKNTELTEKDVDRILDVMKIRGYIDSASKKIESVKFIPFIYDFWDYENSEYVKEKKAHGQKINKTRCVNMTGNITNHWKSYFSDKNISDITKKELKAFSLEIAGNGLAPGTVNNILDSGMIPLRWAAENGIIKSNPTKGILKFSGKAKKVGILTDEEARRLFSEGEWKDDRGKLANLLSCQTGMRLGEVRALQLRDIEGDRIVIRHSYSAIDGFKSTKTTAERAVPILPDLKKQLIELAKLNPKGYQPDSFIFFSTSKIGEPLHGNSILNQLKVALNSIGISENERKARSLKFHSWRHWYARKMSDVLSERTAKLTGHATPSMLEHYSNHADEKDFQSAIKATEQVFGRFLKFRKEA